MLLPNQPALRRAVSIVMILGSAAGVAAMWNSFAPPNACLFCAAPEQYGAALGGTSASGTSGISDAAHPSYQRAAADTIPLPGMPPSSAYGGDGGRIRSEGSRSGWQPWGNGSDSRGFNASGAGGPSVGMGGLWRLMSLAHRNHPSAAAGPAAPHAAREPRPARSARPAPAPRPAPRPAPTPTPMPAAPAIDASSPFDTQATSPPSPFVAPPPGGSLDPGGPGGTHGAGGGSTPSAKPEPASILLLGTGLLALLTELRRRSAI